MFTIKFKDGKSPFPNGIKGPVVLVLEAMASFGLWFKLDEIVITAGEEPGHAGGAGGPSYHEEGLAVDNRTHDWSPDVRDSFFSFMRTRLGEFYDVVYEGDGTKNAHGHIEYDRRRAEQAGVYV